MASFLTGLRSRLAAASVSVLTAGLLAACGDSASSSSSTGGTGGGGAGGSTTTTTTTTAGGGGGGGETGGTTTTLPTGGGGGGGQTGPTSDAFFAPDGIARIDLTLSDLALESLSVSPGSYVHGDAQIELAAGDTLSIPDIGVRLKGVWGSFRTMDQKAAFLLKFDEYHKKQKPMGLEKLAVNNMVQDPSMIHEQLAYAMFRAMDVPAPRTSYARVYVNGALYGLYATIEVLDNSELLQTWFNDDTGSLYEGQYGSDLEDGLLTTYDQDNGPDVGFADLQALKDALDGMTTPDTFFTDAGAVIDMERYVRFSATEIFIGDWDGYAWNRNNYFMYRGPDSRWAWLPWGADQTFSDLLPIWGGSGRIQQMCGASLPCRQKLKTAFQAASAEVDALGLIARCDQLRDLIDAAMLEDPRKEVDPGTVYGAIQNTKDFLWYRKSDVASQLPCADPSVLDADGDGSSGCGIDCNDNDPNVYPGAPEACNMADDNCNGLVDEDPMCPGCVLVPAAGGGTLGLCFKTKPYLSAEADCAAQGGHLASIHSQAEQDEIVDAAFSVAGGQWWIGLTDAEIEGLFTWTDGTPLDYTDWTAGEPNNAGDEDCAHLADWAGAQWNDMPCDTPANYVCRLP